MYYRGDRTLLDEPTIAIVGSRAATPLGCKIAFAVAAWFASQGIVIVSGLANGIDEAAHEGALSVAGGRTIAVLGTPFASISASKLPLLMKMEEPGRGLLMTQYRSGYATKRYFERDLVIARIADMVIPVMAARNSGTLHTVHAAIQMKKLLYMPRPIARDEAQSPVLYEGIHDLIRTKQAVVFSGKEDYPAMLEQLSAVRSSQVREILP